ncbi:MAG: pyridoxal phosphate-dependent aminotransferase [Tepidamorphaceae bacterium]|nr:pyridoxal phosphate-dependent aminotransferase [Rhodobiaceae bacterium]MCC0050213.1 pyridoxal phosphate-dependent aminotransferase [Rhodobiaceae bacterium]
MTPPAYPLPAGIEALSARASQSPESGIVEVLNYGIGRQGIIPLWAGEGDVATPAFICDAAATGLAEGDTFYTYQRGIPPLRDALARYTEWLYGRPNSFERFFVTGSGMQAIQTAILLTADPGDEIVYHAPAWPNLPAAATIAGVTPVSVAMNFSETGWWLDLERVFAAVSERTRAICINSPSNPTGWVMPQADLETLLNFCRERGIWIIADEVYNRFVYGDVRNGAHGRPLAPSFHDVITPEDRVLFVNTFSKNWAMTGWRIGWIEAPEAIGIKLENLIQYSTSGVAGFMQRAALTALQEGDEFAESVIADARRGREIVSEGLKKSGRCRFTEPDGAFYAFFGIEGEPDTDRLGLRLVDEAGIGIAPGRAFGPEGAGYMRLCFVRRPSGLGEAMNRLNAWLTQR